VADGKDGGTFMKITIIVEGETEQAFKRYLQEFLKDSLEGRMPKLDFFPYHGPIPRGDKLRRMVSNLLNSGRATSDYVIALTDVYTGKADFTDASDAKAKMRQWVGNEPRFHAHTALHDFEAWLLPYWNTIQKLAGHNRRAPTGDPESVNHNKPPAYHIKEIFEVGRASKSYVKPRDGMRILKENGLSGAVTKCPELKAFINTIIAVCGGTPIP
jgi:hypothetical protein